MKKLFFLLFFLWPAFAFSADKVMIQIRFCEPTAYGEYCDALYFSQEEYSKITQTDVDKLKQERVDNWINMIKNAPIPQEPTLEDLNNQLMEVQRQFQEIKDEIDKKTITTEALENIKSKLTAEIEDTQIRIDKKVK